MKTRWLAILTVTALAIGWSQWPRTSAGKKTAALVQPPRHFPAQPNQRPKMPDPLIQQERKPASVPQVGMPFPSLENIKLDPSMPVGKKTFIVPDLAVTEEANYRPELGAKVHFDGRFVFYRSPVVQEKSMPVAYDKVNRSLLPVSHILHVKGADEALRASLLAEGLKQYYYQPKLKFLSLETSSTTVLRHYQELKGRGYEVRLEVIRPGVQPN